MTRDKIIYTIMYSMSQLEAIITEDAINQGTISEYERLIVTDFYKVTIEDGQTVLKVELESASSSVH